MYLKVLFKLLNTIPNKLLGFQTGCFFSSRALAVASIINLKKNSNHDLVVALFCVDGGFRENPHLGQSTEEEYYGDGVVGFQTGCFFSSRGCGINSQSQNELKPCPGCGFLLCGWWL
jgi:hypothetical protein